MEMARRDDQDLYDVSDAKSRVLVNLHRSGSNRSLPVPRRSRLEQCGAKVQRYRHSGTEPTLDEVLREPAIRLMMKRDNLTEDQLLYIIRIASRHINR
jgi:hypothetical protein